MIKKKYVTDVLAQGPKKFMGIAKLTSRSKARRIDILLTPEDELPYALLYFTGSDAFNVAMRKHALERGYSLSEHGLKRIRDDVPISPKMSSERDIFTFLDYRYVVPEGRNEKNL
jgi:DNA polymerase/3'-5' exonuclease PolX